MVENGTATFASPDEYCAAIKAAKVDLFVTAGGEFKGRLTRFKLGRLHVLRGQENLPRISFVALPPTQVHISFPLSGRPGLIYCGLGLNRGDLIFHSLGERAHQRTAGDGDWCVISLPREELAACSKTLIGKSIRAPSESFAIVPARGPARLLLSQLSRACHLAETREELIASPRVTRSLEQDLLSALVNCLSTESAERLLKWKGRHADIMARFEEALAVRSEGHLNLSGLCATIGVPERTLRLCCAEFLGMSPGRYHLLRRLNKARSALRRANPNTASVSEIARDHQFTELGRFAVAYRAVFGETPSSTLRRVSNGTE
ncbi:AraC family transcriptional regulator [Bradyrhizobium rifense]|uniref:AraC family transcriptional regulator n=1 Tax=Bradyrhizobium rifense TaxID=515499 RepID=A0A5D3K0T9_9BRAD|nr:helix-turn-helix transcriptional regulator [Bradyrhizobium rifense]TYL86673.1 AraC family transcriptional regulator [Bradyrhizobium rifense]